jgi:hypothetical protein
VRWFQVRKELAIVEKKDKIVPPSAAEPTLPSDRKFENFESGPELFSLTGTEARWYGEFQNRLDDNVILGKLQNKNFYEITLTNKGGLVMPVIIEWTFTDGSKEVDRIPAEIWRNNETKLSKIFTKDKQVTSVTIDPLKETSDINVDDNTFPRIAQVSKFDELKKQN